jgi:hypothetical protein
VKTDRFLTGVFETGYQATAHDRECCHQEGRSSAAAEKSETEVVSVADLFMKSLFSQEE